MTKGAMAALSAGVAVFGFDPEPGTPASRALHVLTLKRTLPTGDLGPKERFPEAAMRAAAEAGIDLGGRRGARGGQRLHLVGVDDDPARARSVTVWYYAASPYGPVPGPGVWSATGRGLRLDATGAAALRAALDRLRADTRQLAGAAALVGDVFTGDDLLRLHVALHGGPEGSERTFRRRIQELRDSGVLKPVRDTEVAALRLRVPRFRSPAGTGGRPPELLRYSGAGERTSSSRLSGHVARADLRLTGVGGPVRLGACQDQGDRSVVGQVHGHVGAEPARLDPMPEPAQRSHERLVKRLGPLRGSGADE